MAPVRTSCWATGSLTCRPSFAKRCLRTGASLRSRVARRPDVILKSGTCLACGVCASAPVRALSQWTCAPGILALKKAPRDIFIASAPGGWFPRGFIPGPVFFSHGHAGLSASHVHVGLKGPSPSVPGSLGRAWLSNTVWLFVRPGACLSALLTSTGTGAVLWPVKTSSLQSMPLWPRPRVPCLDSCQPWRAFLPPPTRGGGLLVAYHKIWPFRVKITRNPDPASEEAANGRAGICTEVPPASPTADSADTVAGAGASDGANNTARQYLEACRVETTPPRLSSMRLAWAGSVEKAACVLNQERVAFLGNHLSFTEDVIGISDLHKAYLIGTARGPADERPLRKLAKATRT